MIAITSPGEMDDHDTNDIKSATSCGKANHVNVNRIASQALSWGCLEPFDSLKNPDFVAVCVFAIIGLLMTILMARIFPLDKAVDLLLLSS